MSDDNMVNGEGDESADASLSGGRSDRAAVPPRPVQPPASTWLDQTPPEDNRRWPGGGVLPWLIGGGALVLVAVIVGVVVGVSGGGAVKPRSVEKPTQLEKEKAFTIAPKECDLIKPTTLAKLVPDAECSPSAFGTDKAAAGGLYRMPQWDSRMQSRSLDVNLFIGSSAAGQYEIQKESAASALAAMQSVTDSHAVKGVGDKAYLVKAADKEPFTGRTITLVVNEGNAMFTLKYSYEADSGVAEQQAEQDVMTAARDVLGGLR